MSTLALLADVGGTNARFALLRDGAISAPVLLSTADFATLNEALLHAVSMLDAPRIDAVAMCAAGPRIGDTISLTNCSWQISTAELAKVTNTQRVVLVNDFTALAASLPHLRTADMRYLGGGSCDLATTTDLTRAVIGPGTGLGMSACMPHAGSYCFIAGEGGNADLAAANEAEALIITRLRARFGHVSAERVLSGPGLVNLYRAMHPGAGGETPACGSAIAALAMRGDADACACLRQFSAWLGAVAGDLALTVGARGGIYLAGGILGAWGALFPVDAFRARFVAKGHYEAYLAAIPTWLITMRYPALTGLQNLLAQAPGRA